MTLADGGYHSGRNLEECARREQVVAMPQAPRRRSAEHPYHRYNFTYELESDSYICPQGQTLRFVGVQRSGKVMARRYRGSAPVCRSCPAFGMCTKDGVRGRSLVVSFHDEALYRHRAWMSTDEAREVYKLRKQLVEPVFGIVKEQQNVRRFLLRGLANVAAEWTVLATAFNMRVLWQKWRSRRFTFRRDHGCFKWLPELPQNDFGLPYPSLPQTDWHWWPMAGPESCRSTSVLPASEFVSETGSKGDVIAGQQQNFRELYTGLIGNIDPPWGANRRPFSHFSKEERGDGVPGGDQSGKKN